MEVINGHEIKNLLITFFLTFSKLGVNGSLLSTSYVFVDRVMFTYCVKKYNVTRSSRFYVTQTSASYMVVATRKQYHSQYTVLQDGYFHFMLQEVKAE